MVAKLFLIVYALFISSKYVVNGEITNICDTYGLCSQRCIENNNNYVCSCDPGFQLGANNRTCYPTDPNWNIIYGTNTELVITDRNGQEGKLPFTTTTKTTCFVTYDARNDLVYWTDCGGSVYKAGINSYRGQEIFADTGIGSGGGIAVDWITGNLYVVDTSWSHIVVCSNSCTLCSVVVDSTYRGLSEIALDPNSGIMIWTGIGLTSDQIWRSEMDGTSATCIVCTGLTLLKGIAMDQANERVYWADWIESTIASCRLDGTDRRITMSSVDAPVVIGVLGNRLFWGEDIFTVNIKSANKFNGKNAELNIRNIYDNFSERFTLMHLANQPIFRDNPCQNVSCSHICTLTRTHFRCMCPFGWILENDNITCVENWNLPWLVVGSKRSLKTAALNAIGKSVFKTVELNGIQSIDSLIYNPVDHSVVIRDSESQKIFEYYLQKNLLGVKILVNGGISGMTEMGLDPVTKNLYWIDGGNSSVMVMSLLNGAQRSIRHFLNSTYQSILVDFLNSILYLANKNEILEMGLDGSILRAFTLEHKRLISLTYNGFSGSTYWVATTHNTTEFGLVGENNSTVNYHTRHYVDFAMHDDALYCTTANSSLLKFMYVGGWPTYYISLGNVEKFAKLAITNPNIENLDRLRNQHDCSPENPNGKKCSHICLPTRKPLVGTCECPSDFTLQSDNKTCISALHAKHYSKQGENNVIRRTLIRVAAVTGIVCVMYLYK